MRDGRSEPDPSLYSLSSEKFVTRAEHDLLQQKVMQLETIVATLAPRAFLGGLDHLNLPMGPPPFTFGPPPPGHPGGPPQQHPYPGPPPNAGAPGAPVVGGMPGSVPPTPHELHQAYQQHFHGYPAPSHPAPPQHQQQHAAEAPQASDTTPAVAHLDDNSRMDVDQQAAQNKVEQLPGGEPHKTLEEQNRHHHHQLAELATLMTPPGGKTEQPPQAITTSRPKGRKRKQADSEDVGEDISAAHGSTRGGATVRGRGKGRGVKAAAAAAAAATLAANNSVPTVTQPGQWNAAAAAAAEAVAMAAAAGSGGEEQAADIGETGVPAPDNIAS